MARELTIRITADNADANQALRETERGLQSLGTTATRDGGKVSTVLSNNTRALDGLVKMAPKLRTVGTGLSIGVTAPIVGMGSAAVTMGMQAVESENLFSASFGDMADAARRWSEATSDALGLNAFELRRTAGVLYTMTTAMGLNEQAAFDMSTGVSELAGDLSSFFNISNEDAFTKLRAGLVGETEPLRQLGVVLSAASTEAYAYANGIAEAGSELTEAEKVQARWGLILEQTSTAQGDLARTLDSPTNQLRIMRAEMSETTTALGIALLPMFQQFLDLAARAVPYISAAVDWFTKLPEPVKSVGLAFAGIAAVAGPFLAFLGGAISAVSALAPVFSAGGTAASLLGGALSILTGPVGLVVAAVVGLVAAWLKWGDEITEVVTSTFAVVKEWLWDKLEPVITPIIGLLESVGEMFWAFARLVGAVVGKVLDLHMELLRGVTMFLLDRLRPVIEPAKRLFESVATVVGAMTTAVVGYAQRFYEGVKTWLLDRFTSIVDGIKSKVDAVTGFFENMYTAVVGNSFVPDMVAGIQESFDSLQTVMVDPAALATTAVNDLFSGMQGVAGTVMDGMQSLVGNALDNMLGSILDKVPSFQSAWNSIMSPSSSIPLPGGGSLGIPNPTFMMGQAWLKSFLGPHGNPGTAPEDMPEELRTHENQQVIGFNPWDSPLDDVGVPMATGGIVLPRPGGTLIRAGEAGMAEAIVPLDRADVGGTIEIHNHFENSYVDRQALDRFASEMMRRLPDQLRRRRLAPV